MTDKAELRDWLRLLVTPKVGRVTARTLLQHFGLPGNIFAANPADLASFVSPAQARALSAEPEGFDALLSDTCSWLEFAPDRRAIVAMGDALYPEVLLLTPDPPLLLFLQGQIHLLDKTWEQCAHRGIAVVGSRNPTPQGSATAQLFAQALVEHDCCIISGMALGIDGAAHLGALKASHPDRIATIAVVGTGLDRVYPKSHLQLAHQISEYGLLVSEFPLGTPPSSSNFPLRNRIIAGLARATLVVEAALKSGSLITAQQALEQGKEVLAIPGSIHSPQAKGCHALIKQGAKLVESAEDILEELGAYSFATASPTSTGINPAAAESGAHPLMDFLGYEPSSLDEIVSRSSLSAPEVQSALTELELDGLISRLPGGLYQRIS